jgi:cytoskeletal protein RodZ
MSSVGELLQEARLAQQLDLTAVSERTRISVRYLEAIEANDRKVLPSGFFYKSFVDQYARFLG